MGTFKNIIPVALLFFIGFVLLTSCRTSRQVVDFKKEVQIEKVVEYRDTIIYTTPSTTSLNFKLNDFENLFKTNLNEGSSPLILRNQNGNANVKIKVIRDSVFVTATCDSLAIVAKIKSEFEKQLFNQELNSTKKAGGISFLTVLFLIVIAAAAGYLYKTFI